MLGRGGCVGGSGTQQNRLRFFGAGCAAQQRQSVRGKVGGEKPQTPQSYRSSVEGKFPPGYYEKLEKCFRTLFKEYPPSALNGRIP